MSETKERSSIGDLGTFVRLFGLPPLLSNEKLEHFEEMMNRLTACLCPEDFVVSLFIYQVAIETWRLMRLKRFEALMVDRWRGADQTLVAQMEKAQQQHKAEQEEAPELFKDATNEATRYVALSPLWDRVENDHRMIEARADEIKLMGTFERGIEKLQDLGLLTDQCQKRLNEAYCQIHWYRTSLAQDLRREADAIVEAEIKKIGTVPAESPLVPQQGVELDEV